MRSKKREYRPLSMETLEPRLPMAGNINVQAVGGDLILKGDGNLTGNQVEIVETGAANNYLVRGLNGTKINNLNSVTFPGIARDIKATFGEGNDLLRITGAFRTVAIRDVLATMGAGNDTFEFLNESARNITVNQANKAGRSDDDLVNIQAGGGTTVGRIEGSLTLNNAVGTDTIDLVVDLQKNIVTKRTDGFQRLDLRGSEVAGSITINNKSPASRPSNSFASATIFDNIGNTDVFVGQGVTLNLGSGLHDVFSDEFLVAKTFAIRGSGNSGLNIEIADTRVGGDFVVSGQGAVIDFQEGFIFGKTNVTTTRFATFVMDGVVSTGDINLKSPVLTAMITNFLAGNLTVQASAQGLAMLLQGGIVSKNLKIVGSNGVDTIAIDDINVIGNTLIDMRGGNDTLVVEDDANRDALTNFFGTVTVKSGEGRDTIKVMPDLADDQVTVYGTLSLDFDIVGDPDEALVDIGLVKLVGRLA